MWNLRRIFGGFRTDSPATPSESRGARAHSARDADARDHGPAARAAAEAGEVVAAARLCILVVVLGLLAHRRDAPPLPPVDARHVHEHADLLDARLRAHARPAGTHARVCALLDRTPPPWPRRHTLRVAQGPCSYANDALATFGRPVPGGWRTWTWIDRSVAWFNVINLCGIVHSWPPPGPHPRRRCHAHTRACAHCSRDAANPRPRAIPSGLQGHSRTASASCSSRRVRLPTPSPNRTSARHGCPSPTAHRRFSPAS